MANDSAYNILGEFKDDSLNEITSGGFVEYSPIGQPGQKDPVNVEIATQDVQNEDYYDIMADYFAGDYLPVKEQGLLDFQQEYEALGLGKKTTPQQFRSIIEQSIGEIPKTSTTDKAIRFLFDSLNAKTPFYGTAGVFDVLAQATGKFLDREQAQEALEIERRLAIGELAAKQSAEANKDMFLKEAELRTKLLGYNQELAKSYLNFGEETRNKMLQFDLDVAKDKIKTSNEMLKNLQKPISMVYTTDGENYIPTAVQLRPNEDMTEIVPYSLQKVEQEDGTTKLEFREGPPEGTKNFYFTTSVSDPSESATKASDLAAPTANQYQEAIATYYGLKTSGNLVEDIILKNNESVRAGEGPTVGIRGLIGKLKQGFTLTLGEALDEIKSSDGVSLNESLVQFGEAKIQDMRRLEQQAKQGDEMADSLLDTDFSRTNTLPITLETFSKPNGKGKKSEVTLPAGSVSLNQLLDPLFLQINYNYQPAYAENVVREKIIAYSLARALKTSGRLNVDDLEQAREAVQLYGFVSSQDVITRLGVILESIRNAQRNTILSLKFGSNIDLLEIDPELKKDFNQLENFMNETGQGMESLYNRVNTQPQVESQEPSGNVNNNPEISDEAPEALDINNWVGGQ